MISGDYATVGAYQDDEGAGLDNNGSVTIFSKRNTTNGVWEPNQISRSICSKWRFSGICVHISGDYAIV
ncbi:MAG: hypothetical protein IPJ39_22035 [Saprospiraceae bacterium]|nr:hypothetical protein [Saprospiraceae bacterium]